MTCRFIEETDFFQLCPLGIQPPMRVLRSSALKAGGGEVKRRFGKD